MCNLLVYPIPYKIISSLILEFLLKALLFNNLNFLCFEHHLLSFIRFFEVLKRVFLNLLLAFFLFLLFFRDLFLNYLFLFLFLYFYLNFKINFRFIKKFDQVNQRIFYVLLFHFLIIFQDSWFSLLIQLFWISINQALMCI